MQVEQRRRDEAAEDDEGHRVFDLLSGLVARDEQRNEGHAGCQGRHQDRGEAYFGSGRVALADSLKCVPQAMPVRWARVVMYRNKQYFECQLSRLTAEVPNVS